MTRWLPWPRSLAGQMALLVALALFAAQALNFAMVLRERRAARFTQITAPAITRIVDAAERLAATGALPAPPPRPDRPPRERDLRGGPPRSRVQLLPSNPVPASLPNAAEVEKGIRQGLAESQLPAGVIVTGIRPFDPSDARLHGPSSRRSQRFQRAGSELIVAVEQPGKGWLVTSAPWPRSEGGLLARLIAQTLILYGALLIPVLWLARRISRPLGSLASAARRFRPGTENEPLPEAGPPDVRDVIGAFNALQLRVRAMLDEKDRMLGAIGHDLRTPLAALRVRIESVDDDGDRARMADLIDEMSRTLEDILSLARLGRPSEQKVDVDLAALVDAVVEDFRDLGAEVEAEDAPRLILPLRPTLMRRAVRNLIENAVKYAGAAEVRLFPSDRHVRIEIADRGPGIAGEQLDAVFEAFTRIENSRNRDTGGIGLGLALTRAIVREAGGEVLLQNRDGGGLLATIVLPRAG